ncbi:MAG: restriction endonuclease [Steroidobacteraceae bacterium]
MPKRTNEFQRLVYLVQTNLADGAKVKESLLMRDRLSGGRREVDIVIFGKVGQHDVIVSIECRDHKRVADIQWVDAMRTKHDQLDTSALILASSKGFTPEARAVAEKYGIALFTLEDLGNQDLSMKFGLEGTLWHKTFNISATEVKISVKATKELVAERIAVLPDNLMYLTDGRVLGEVKDFVSEMLKTKTTGDYLQKEGKEEHKFFEIFWAPPRDHLGRPLYMQMIKPSVKREIESIRVVGTFAVSIGRFGLRYGRMGNVDIAWGKAVIDGRQALAVATISDSGEKKLSLHVEGSAVDPKVKEQKQ